MVLKPGAALALVLRREAMRFERDAVGGVPPAATLSVESVAV
jgi:hypothetical protein